MDNSNGYVTQHTGTRQAKQGKSGLGEEGGLEGKRRRWKRDQFSCSAYNKVTHNSLGKDTLFCVTE